MQRLSPRLLAVLAIAAVAVPGTASFLYVEGIHEAAFQRHVRSEAKGFAVRLDEQWATRLALADSLSREVEVGIVSRGPSFEGAALTLQERFPGYQAINLVDRAGSIVQVVPTGPNQAALGRSIRLHPSAGPVFEETMRTGQARVTGPQRLFQGGMGFAGYFPVEGGSRGYVNAVFRVGPVVDRLLDEEQLENLRVEVWHEREVIYATGATVGLAAETHGHALSGLGPSWRVEVMPTLALRSTFHPFSSPLLLVLWLVSSVLVGGLVYRVLVARERRAEMGRRLAQSSRMDALGTMAGGIAHDFNNALTVMLSTLEVLREELSPSSPHAADIDRLTATCVDAAALTRQLLSLASQPALEGRLFAPDQVLAGARPLLERLLSATQAFEWRLGAPDAQVMGDPGAFRQAVTNLVINARDAMEHGGTLTIRTRAQAGQFELQVKDTGEGMTQATMQRIFDPFFTTKPVGSGTGLGLAMVFGTVERMTGRIDVKSQVGQGTCFDVQIPLADPVADRMSPLDAEEVSALQGARVLVAEDDPSIRAAFARTLTRAGYAVTEAADGEEGVALLGRSFDLIVTDVEMPGLRGPQMVKRFRQLQPELPVLYCTGFARPDEQLVTSLNTVVLEKPFALRELVVTAEALLHHSQEGALDLIDESRSAPRKS